METAIQLENMRFYAYHGVSMQERQVGNDYLVSLTVHTPFGKAMTSDDLSQTINYAALYERVKKEMMIPSKLLEHVAGRIITDIRNAYPQITGLTLSVSKLNPPICGEIGAASVIITV